MTRDFVLGEVYELLADGASVLTVVEEGELVDSVSFRATTLAIRAMTSEARTEYQLADLFPKALLKERTEYQLAGLFTKSFLKERFEYFVHMIGMRCMTPAELECLAKLSS
nr:ribonuclease H-like domain-containing protein [Tanacetum cinerariifolium]